MMIIVRCVEKCNKRTCVNETLMVSTLRNLFAGNKDLFTGLWIDAHGDWSWESFPVILLDFNAISHNTPENLALDLEMALLQNAQGEGIELQQPLLKGKFQ
jgi:hypothetical protein